ncbi:MAG: hypothetical protein JM58_06450 [Peptococcaceae bacterium BICA1-8]|nr:MAG: hypothetical protein JM58_06450 [Peptococcaceae bacterium BICA1-8]
MKRRFICFIFIGIFLTLFSLDAKASELLPGMSDGQWYYHETFSDKNLDNNQVKDNQGKVRWQINTVEGQTNAITDTKALELGDAQYMQRAVLAEELWANKQNYAMEFTINIQKLGNEGHSGRPIAVIIPRSKDKELNEYYGVTYYMETTQIGSIVANLYKCKWAIVNTAAPTKMEPLVEGYFLLRENVDYTARLVIQNTYEGNVNIKFYIDGPVNPVDEFKPLLEYTDSSPHKISSGVTGPAFGMAGFSDDGWGTSPVVRYDNIRLYDLYQFGKYEEQLKKYALINPNDIKANKAYGEIKYLINRGILDGYPDNNFKPYEFISVAKFLKMLITLKGEKYPEGQSHWADNYINRGIELGIIEKNEFSDYNRPVTKYDVALMITRFNGNPTGDKSYVSFIKDNRLIPDKYLNAVLYTYYEGYLRLNDNFSFTGNSLVNQSEAASIILRMLDAGFRKVNNNLELPHILSSGAVLQGNKKIPIWGRGVSGETITVRFKNQIKTTVVKNGNWYLELEPEPYGGTHTLSVNNTKDTIKLEDIKVGEVFIVAGQSNAEMYLNECYGADETRKKFVSNPNNLRFYSGEQIMAVRPNFTSVGEWSPSYDWALDYSPAIGTFFVEKLLELNKELANVTIGVIPITYGGTTIEVFMPKCILEEKKYVQRDDEPIMSGFWNGFIDAVAPYGSKAVMYYQGENSTQLGYNYESLLRDYLRGFRNEFKNPNLPFMLVQISGYGENYYESDLDSWPIIREVQMKVANTTNNTGIVPTIDLSDPNPMEIHPKEKKTIGERLAYLAMELVYHNDLRHRSPEVKFYRFEDNKAIIGFDYIYGPIYLKDNISKGFEILDEKNKWHEAQAKVNQQDNTLIVWNDNISLPKGVRYAWRNYPGYSLYNAVDFPAFPFKIINVDNTGSNALKISNHLLNTQDAIVNITRNNIFRVVDILDTNTISHVYAIGGQTVGDTIEKFTRLKNLTAQEGTTEKFIKISQHGFTVGDWIRNNTRGWEPRRVNAVLDEDTFEVALVKGQSAGDDIGRYQFIEKVVAE